MNQDQFKQFLLDQREEMLKHKYLESEKACIDLGQIAINDWITKYAKLFRKQWEQNHSIDI